MCPVTYETDRLGAGSHHSRLVHGNNWYFVECCLSNKRGSTQNVPLNSYTAYVDQTPFFIRLAQLLPSSRNDPFSQHSTTHFYIMRRSVLRARGRLARAHSRTSVAPATLSCYSAPCLHVPLIARARLNASLAPSAVSASPSSSSRPTDSDSDTRGSDGVDHITIDLGTIGAEDAKVLTIADVLNTREQALGTNETLCDYEEWQSVADTVRQVR